MLKKLILRKKAQFFVLFFVVLFLKELILTFETNFCYEQTVYPDYFFSDVDITYRIRNAADQMVERIL